VHENARLTPLGREWLAMLVMRGQALQAVGGAVGVLRRMARLAAAQTSSGTPEQGAKKDPARYIRGRG
jgi:hypothetical protein